VDLADQIAQLDDDDQVTRMAAAARLVDAPPVGPLIDALCHANAHPSPGAYPYRRAKELERVLHAIGEPAMEPLVTGIAEAEDWGRVVDLGSALTGLRVGDVAAYLPLLRHPSSAVRDRVLLVFEDLGPGALPYLPDVLPLLADPEDHVRGRAAMAVQKMGPGVVPLLRDRRREPWPQRRLALRALAEVGGWDALDAADQALVRRLIRTKIPHETPEPMYLCGHWYAVPTTDQAAVLAALGLGEPTPVTMRLGEAMWHGDHHGLGDGPGTCVYVTPGWDGWTLVFGHYPSGEEPPATLGTLALLSRRFGAAHWYYVFEGCTGWGTAEHGEIVRQYDSEDPDGQVGPPLPAEKGYLLPHEDPYPDDAFADLPLGDTEAFGARIRQLKAELGIPDECDATDIAARTSVDPGGIGPHTRVEGHGVLTVTDLGRRAGIPTGKFPI
jgi:hypothetical protein